MRLFKTCFFLLMLPTLVMANPTVPEGKYTKEKKIKKDYNVASDATLSVTNKYGNVNISSWNQNRIEIEVTIKTSSNNEQRAIDKLNQIDVAFEANQRAVTAKTQIESERWSWGWNSSNVSLEINYLIKMPVTNFLMLNHDYGNITIDRLDARVDIDCDYGRMDIGSLNATGNKLSFDYTNNVVIDYIKDGEINADYSSYRIENAGSLRINADYTKSEVRKADKITYDADYGSLQLGTVRYVSGNSDYLTQEFEQITGSLDLDADYGSVKIRNLSDGFDNIKIRSNYVNVKIGISPQTHFRFDFSLKYAKLRSFEGLNFDKKIISGSQENYVGSYGSPQKGNLSIQSSYGNLTLTEPF
jgi:hypothetical protein